MAEFDDRTVPSYQIVDGIRIPIGFNADIFRSGLSYKPKPGDLFISTYPKCGTTWTQTIVYLICDGGKQPKSAVDFYRKTPYIDITGSEWLEKAKEIYAIKIHVPFERSPFSSQSKYIYVARNPKDTVVSYFHHSRNTVYLFEDGEFDVFFNLFMEGKADYGDFFDHVLGWYEHRNDENVLFITYEELKKDTRGMILKIAQFMGQEYEDMLEKDPQVLENVLKYSSLEEMKKIFNTHMEETAGNLSLTKEDVEALPLPEGIKHLRRFGMDHRRPNSQFLKLIRSGQVGGWKNTLSKEQGEMIDRRIKEKLSGTYLYDLWKDI